MRTAARRLPLGLALLATLAGGCGDDSASDAGGGDGSVGRRLPTCEDPLVLEGVEGGTATVELDTSSGGSGTLDVSECFSTTQPQAVIAYRVPGTGPHAMAFSLRNPGTDPQFDAEVIVRDGPCLTPVVRDFPPHCWEDEPMLFGDYRPEGRFGGMGGETVTLIVTGYPWSDGSDYRGSGRFRLDVTATANSPPQVSAAVVLAIASEVEVEATATDADFNALGVMVSFHDDTKALVDVNGSGQPDAADVLWNDFAVPVTGAISFRESATFSAEVLGSAEAWVRVYDDGYFLSNRFVLPVVAGRRVGLGQPCDATNICLRELDCMASMCAANSERAGACTGAEGLTIDTPTTMTTSTTAMGTLMEGTGLFRGPCGSTIGREQIFLASVPGGMFDLIASTDNPGSTVGADTVVYLRGSCVDPESSPLEWCDDDSGDSLLSTLVVEDVPAGTYAIFVEDYGGVVGSTPTRFELSVSLRPVIGTGQTCDPLEVQNRCAGDPCPTEGGTCP